jgi:hypothetical protein
MSFFKNLFTDKSEELPLESRMSAISKEAVDNNPRNRRLNSSNFEESSSRRNKTMKEENRHLNMLNQELNNENETLKDQISDLRMTVKTNKMLLEDFIQNNNKKERQMQLLNLQVTLMTQKLRENCIEFEEELDMYVDYEKGTRSNSPTVEGPWSTVNTDRLAKGTNFEKTRSEHNVFTTSLSGPHSDDKYSSNNDKGNKSNSLFGFSKSRRRQYLPNEENKADVRFVSKNSQDEGSVISSTSPNNMVSSRTAPEGKHTVQYKASKLTYQGKLFLE